MDRLGRTLSHLRPCTTAPAAADAPAPPSPPPLLRAAVTGSSSGIGLEFVRQLAADGYRVHALCRTPSGATELQAIAAAHPASVSVHTHDQASGSSCAALAAELAGTPIDLLVQNAGVGGSGPTRGDFSQDGQTFGAIDYDAWGDALQTNVLGVMRTVEALTPSLLLSPSPRLVHISGIFGSLTNQVRAGTPSPDVAERTGSAGYFIYRSSKAAANMVAK